jgi:hypothetical protein
MIDTISNNEGGLSIREKLNNVIESVNEFDNLFPVNLATDTTGFLSWSAINATPTTLSGYGITDAVLTGEENISDPNVAYIRSDGSDTHGEIGNPHKPYLTLQAAYDDGARTFDVGVGTFAGMDITNATTVSLRGKGIGKTVITTIAIGQAVVIEDSGSGSFKVQTIQRTDSEAFASLTLRNVNGDSISLEATQSQPAATILMYGACVFSSITINGFGATDEIYSSSGGSLSVYGSLRASSINAMGGNGSSFFGPSQGGSVYLTSSSIDGVGVYIDGGFDDIGLETSSGSLTVVNSFVTSVNGNTPNINSYSSTVTNVNGSGPIIGGNYASYLGGY